MNAILNNRVSSDGPFYVSLVEADCVIHSPESRASRRECEICPRGGLLRQRGWLVMFYQAL